MSFQVDRYLVPPTPCTNGNGKSRKKEIIDFRPVCPARVAQKLRGDIPVKLHRYNAVTVLRATARCRSLQFDTFNFIPIVALVVQFIPVFFREFPQIFRPLLVRSGFGGQFNRLSLQCLTISAGEVIQKNPP